MQGAGSFLCADQEVLTIMEMAFTGTKELSQIMKASACVVSSCGDPSWEIYLWAQGTEAPVFFLIVCAGAGSTCCLTLNLRGFHYLQVNLGLAVVLKLPC